MVYTLLFLNLFQQQKKLEKLTVTTHLLGQGTRYIFTRARARQKKGHQLPAAGRDGVSTKTRFFRSVLAENLCKDSDGLVLQARAA